MVIGIVTGRFRNELNSQLSATSYFASTSSVFEGAIFLVSAHGFLPEASPDVGSGGARVVDIRESMGGIDRDLGVDELRNTLKG